MLASVYVTQIREIFECRGNYRAVEACRFFRYMVSNRSKPRRCGGEACVVNTRIPVWLLELLRRQGATEKRLLADYPGLEAAVLGAAWDYARRNLAEIDTEIVEHEAE